MDSPKDRQHVRRASAFLESIERRDTGRHHSVGEVVMFWHHDPGHLCRYEALDVSGNGARLRTESLLPEGMTGVVLEFQPGGEPVFHTNRLPEAQIRETAEIQEGILDFTARWLPRYLQSGGHTHGGGDLEVLSTLLRAAISRSIDAPLPEEVALFADWRHDSNNGSEDCRSLLGDPDTIERVKTGKVTHPSQLDWLRSYWPQGLFTHLGLEWDRNERRGRLARGVKFFVNLLPGGKSAATRLPE